MGNRADAEDVSQDVFIKAYFPIDKFKEKSSFSTWLYRIAVNKSLDSIRKRKRDRTVSYDDKISQENETSIKSVFSGEEKDIFEEVKRKQLSEAVQQLINSLPEKYRVVLTLKDIEGLSYKEISKIMGASVTKVSVWLLRARQRLRERLNEVHPGGKKYDL